MESPATVYRKSVEFTTIHGDNSVICFDFFDTLVTRSIVPEYTKKIAARQLSRLLDRQINAQKIYDIRYQFEAELCSENFENGNDLEFNLNQFAERLYSTLESLAVSAVNRFSEEEFIQTVLDLELSVEKQVQVPCQDMVNLLQKLKGEGVKTLLISDFYLPKVAFLELLQHHGLLALFDHIYISCEYLKTKGSGRLYDLIVDDLALKKEDMLMIGDNVHADKKMAEDRGIRALHLDREDHVKAYAQWEKTQKDSRFMQKELLRHVHDHGEMVFPEMSLVLWYFIHRLFDRLMADEVKDVVFLSREGEFLKSLFLHYQHQFFGKVRIRSHYLVASRKSTYIASLASLPKEDFSKLFAQYRDIAPKDFLLSLNFTQVQCDLLCKSLGVDSDKRLVNFPESDEYLTIRNSRDFMITYENLRVSQKNNFFQYIKTFGIDFVKDGLNIIDVGWKGSMQGNLLKILDEKVKISGYYLGLLSSPESHPLLHKTGILFNEIPVPNQFFTVYNNNRSLFEMVLGASHGSGEGYFLSQEEVDMRDNGSLYDGEKIFSTTQNGDVYIAVAEDSQEKQLFAKVIYPLQENISILFQSINQCMLSSFQGAPPEDWFAGQHGRMVFLPKKREVAFFESLYHLENFGVFEFTTFKPGGTTSLYKRMYNLKAVVTDPLLLEIGFWPPVILKHLGIGFYRYIDGFRRYKKVFGLRRLLCILASS